MLSEAQILGLKGTIDCYYWRGKPVARMWPQRRRVPPHPTEAANQRWFGQVQSQIKAMSEPNRDEWRKFVRGTNIVWADAIKTFRMWQNPDKILWPNMWFWRVTGRQTTPGGLYNITWQFWRDNTDAEADAVVLYSLSDTPTQPVVWQAVGTKRRRRAVIAEAFAPQFTGFKFSELLVKSTVTNTYSAIAFRETRYDFVRFCVAPIALPTPRHLVTPIYTLPIRWTTAREQP